MEFLLTAVYDALCEITATEQVPAQVTEQVRKILEAMDYKEYTTKEYIDTHSCDAGTGVICVY